MFYIITNGTSYIGTKENNKGYIMTEDIERAYNFKYAKAVIAMKDLPGNILQSGEWEIVSKFELTEDLSDIKDFDVDNIFNCVEEDFCKLAKKKKVLELEYLAVEREITDIYHCMEFFNLDAAKGYKVYKMMQERLIKRRKIKDEQLKIEFIMGGGISGLTSNKTRKSIDGLANRQYRPRVLQELFS